MDPRAHGRTGGHVPHSLRQHLPQSGGPNPGGLFDGLARGTGAKRVAREALDQGVGGGIGVCESVCAIAGVYGEGGGVAEGVVGEGGAGQRPLLTRTRPDLIAIPNKTQQFIGVTKSRHLPLNALLIELPP